MVARRASFKAPYGSYSDVAAGCLWQAVPRLIACIAALTLAATSGGCSFSYKLGTAFGEDRPERAASAGKGAVQSAAAVEAPEGDLALAKAAAAELLRLGSKDASLPWRNPRTGAHGTVTPIATSYTRDGVTCHDFLASHVQGDQQSWYQGDACRGQGGRWEVRDIRPLQRT